MSCKPEREDTVGVLYSFRRCPYAMRARMALWVSGVICELREVKLADKPPELLALSEKATVPVLQLADGTVLEESLDIMRWALARRDPEGWLEGDDPALIAQLDGPFKHHLDRYKYPTRYEDCDFAEHRAAGLDILREWDARLEGRRNFCGEQRRFVDIASFPFIRQFANTDRAWFDAQPIPNLQRWLAEHLDSELFRQIMPKYAVWQAGDQPVFFGP